MRREGEGEGKEREKKKKSVKNKRTIEDEGEKLAKKEEKKIKE